MTDKANSTPRAEAAAEASARQAGGNGETTALQDFVANMYKGNSDGKGNAASSSPNDSRSGVGDGINRMPQIENGQKGDQAQSGIDKIFPREPKDGNDSSIKIGDLKKHMDDLQIVSPGDQGAIKLNTGDTLVRAGGHEVLVTKEGGSVVVKPDGSYEVKGGTVKYDAKTGETTVDFGNGHTATIRDGHIDSVSDGNHTAWMMQKRSFENLPHGGGWDKDPRRNDPWEKNPHDGRSPLSEKELQQMLDKLKKTTPLENEIPRNKSDK